MNEIKCRNRNCREVIAHHNTVGGEAVFTLHPYKPVVQLADHHNLPQEKSVGGYFYSEKLEGYVYSQSPQRRDENGKRICRAKWRVAIAQRRGKLVTVYCRRCAIKNII
jgi:hypothetical protein